MSELVVGRTNGWSEVGVTVTNAESLLEGVSVLSEDGVGVSMAVTTTEVASVTTTGVAGEGVTLVVPVVEGVVGGVWVGIPVWSPCKIISSVDVGVMVLESINIARFEFLVSPCSVGVSPFWFLVLNVLDTP